MATASSNPGAESGFSDAIYATIVVAGGASAVARAFGVTPQRVRTWYVGDGRMTDEQVEKLAAMARERGAQSSADWLRRELLRQKARRHLDAAEKLLAQAGDLEREAA